MISRNPLPRIPSFTRSVEYILKSHLANEPLILELLAREEAHEVTLRWGVHINARGVQYNQDTTQTPYFLRYLHGTRASPHLAKPCCKSLYNRSRAFQITPALGFRGTFGGGRGVLLDIASALGLFHVVHRPNSLNFYARHITVHWKASVGEAGVERARDRQVGRQRQRMCARVCVRD